MKFLIRLTGYNETEEEDMGSKGTLTSWEGLRVPVPLSTPPVTLYRHLRVLQKIIFHTIQLNLFQ